MNECCNNCIHSSPSFFLLWCSCHLKLVLATESCPQWYLKQESLNKEEEEEDIFS